MPPRPKQVEFCSEILLPKIVLLFDFFHWSGKTSRSLDPLKGGKLLCLAMLRHCRSLWGHNAATRCEKKNPLEYWHCLPSLPQKRVVQTGPCFSHQTPSCLGMATPCKAAHRPTPSKAGMHCHPPLLSETWFLITHELPGIWDALHAWEF